MDSARKKISFEGLMKELEKPSIPTREDIDPLAKAMKVMYDSFIATGFTKAEAKDFIKEVLVRSIFSERR